MKSLIKVFVTVAALATMLQTAVAQQAVTPTAPTEKAFLDHVPQILFEPMFYLWLLVGSILVAVGFTFVRVINVLSKLVLGKEGVVEVVEVKEKEKKESAWSRLMVSLTKAVPVEKEKDVLLDHDYDGIRELDNQLPPWWKWGFVVTIIFAFIYLFYYHVSCSGKLMVAEYDEEMHNAALAKEEMMKKNSDMVTEVNVVRLADEESVSAGKKTFQTYCVACHGDKAQGNVGPNLTDDYWLHGGGIKNVFHTITEGVPMKGMISWKTQLSPKQIQQVASFVLTLKGTNPEGAKAPQGDLYSEPSDSTQSSANKTDSVQINKTAISSL